MDDLTLPQVTRKLEKYIVTLPSARQLNMLSTDARKAMMSLTETAYQLRIDSERYFHADDSAEQRLYLESALELSQLVNDHILAGGAQDLLGPADVAQLSALAEHIRERLQ